MYLRTTQQRRKDGRVVRYLQLAESYRNASGQTVARVVSHLGREDQVDRAGLERLGGAIARFLGGEGAGAGRGGGGGGGGGGAAGQEAFFFSVANLLNLEVDLVFFDTTSTYFEVEPDYGLDADEDPETLKA